jgi:GlpG protein
MTPSIKIRYNAPVILSFVLLSLFALGLARLTNGQSNTLLFSVYPSSWNDPLTYLRLLTHVLGHQDWAHYSANIMLLLLIGPLLEEKYGSLQIAIVILITAIVTGLSHVFFFQSGLMGASGVVFAFIILTSMTGREKGGIPLTFLVVTAVYLGGEIYQMFAVSDNISQITHVIGGAVGALSGSFMRPKLVKIPAKPNPQSPTAPITPPPYTDFEEKPWKKSTPEEPQKALDETEPKKDPIRTEPW